MFDPDVAWTVALNKFSLWLLEHVTGNAILGLKAAEATDAAPDEAAVEAVKAGEAELGPEAEATEHGVDGV